MSDLLQVTDGHLSNVHKYGTSLTFSYFNSETSRQLKLNLNLFIEFKISRPDIYYFTASELKQSFLNRSPYLYMSPLELYGVIHLSNSSYLY